MEGTVKHSLIKTIVYHWRKYGALPILILQLFSMAFFPDVVTGSIVLLWLTVPCGIKAVNNNWFLWYPRQAFFAFCGIALIFDVTFLELMRIV